MDATETSGELDAIRALRIQRSTTAERVAEGLRALIVRGDLRPGSPLREATLGDALGVSRNTLREAFHLLGRDGLVVHEMHRGIEVKRLTQADVRDIYRTRLPLELVAVERTTEVGPERLNGMREALEKARAALAERDWQDVATHDLWFHQALIRLLDSARLNRFFADLLAELRLAFAIPTDQEAFLAPFVAWNEKMLTLIEEGRQGECAEEMQRYLAEAERTICSFLRDNAAQA